MCLGGEADVLTLKTLGVPQHWSKMVTIRPLSSELHSDRADALRIFLAAPSYIELHEFRAPSEEGVEDRFQHMPPETVVAKKSVLGFQVGPDSIGCAEVNNTRAVVIPGASKYRYPATRQ